VTEFALTPQRLATPALSMSYARVPWDSDAFGFGAAQIVEMRVGDAAVAPDAFAPFERWRDEARIHLVSCRLDHLQLRESMLLESRGFRFVELVYHPMIDNLQQVAFADDGIAVSAASQADLPAIEAIAGSAFSTGRFLLDHRLPNALSHARYTGWVRNSMTHPTQRLLKAEEHGRIVGFFVVEAFGQRRCRWHLTAIAPGDQGRGIGKRVWRSVLARHRAEGIEGVDTVVSGHNLAVLNLYAALGFRLRQCEMTLHWWRRDAA
jgi:ribosomal protein S18 acetylase RimI-like enzyme